MNRHNSWYCCQLDSGSYELCRINSRKNRQPDGTVIYDYYVTTYYDGKELFAGSLKACSNWINSHWIERRYLDCYGKD